MKFSIITVCYNSEKTIKETIESVDSQKYESYEHLIIDGMSSDNTIGICEGHYNPKRIIYSEKDLGIFDAMNKGLKKAKGDYILFLNSDDKLHDDYVLQDISKINKNYCLIYGNVLITKKNDIYRNWISGKYSKSLIFKGWMPPHTGTFAKLSLIKKFEIRYDLNFKISSDYDYLINIIKKSKKIKYINRYISVMRHGGNSSRNILSTFRKKYEDYLIIRKNALGGIFALIMKSFSKIKQLSN